MERFLFSSKVLWKAITAFKLNTTKLAQITLRNVSLFLILLSKMKSSLQKKLKQLKYVKHDKKCCMSTSCWDGLCSTSHFKGTPHRVITIVTGHNYIRRDNAELNYRGELALLSKPSVERAPASCSTVFRSNAEEVVGAEPFPSSALGMTKTACSIST